MISENSLLSDDVIATNEKNYPDKIEYIKWRKDADLVINLKGRYLKAFRVDVSDIGR